MSNEQNWNDHGSTSQGPQEGEPAGHSPYGNEYPTEPVPPQHQWRDPQWVSPGQHPGYPGPSQGQHVQQWQGQSSQFHDPNQPYHQPSQPYYDPNDPYAWQQGAHMPGGGPPPKPVYKLWWFWAIIGIVLLGIVALIFVLLPGDDPSPETQNNLTAPAEPDDPENEPEAAQSPDPVEEPDDGIEQGNGGNDDEALQDAQERIDRGYSYWGPDDLAGLLEVDGYDSDAVDHAMANLEVDWDEQAAGAAQELIDSEYNGYSASGIEEYLEYSGFESSHIDHALDAVEVDYNEQAVAALESYQDLFDDSTADDARNYLEYSGFSDAQIDHAFDNVG